MTSRVQHTPVSNHCQAPITRSPADIRALELSSRKQPYLGNKRPVLPSSLVIAKKTAKADAPLNEKPLTTKHLRELRRLCRKTANRAEYDGRGTQLRQIAAILSMVSRFLKQEDVGIVVKGSNLERWLNEKRRMGREWTEEDMLGEIEVEELRRWDKHLKIWGRILRMPELRCGGRWNSHKGVVDPDRENVQVNPLMLSSPVLSDESVNVARTAKTPSVKKRKPLMPSQPSYLNVTAGRTGSRREKKISQSENLRDWSSLRQTPITQAFDKDALLNKLMTPVMGHTLAPHTGHGRLTPLRARLW